MTYEKFEHKVISMLLEGDDPRLEKLVAQTWDFEVLSRDKTQMGFTVKFLSPSLMAIDELEGRIFGVEVRLSESELINLELVIKDGLIERLKGTFTAQMSYEDVIKRYNDLTFHYKDGKSSEVNFHSDNHDLEEVTFVKNIATISKEFDSHILKESDATKVNSSATLAESPINLSLNIKKVEEVKSEVPDEVRIEGKKQEVLETPDEDLIEEPFTLATPDKMINKTEPTIESHQVNERKELDVIEISELVEKSTHTTDITKEATKNTTTILAKEEHIMLPPSFSIPKIPDMIRSRLSREITLPDENLETKKSNNTQIPKKVNQKVTTSNHLKEDSNLEDILDGKAPQGPVSLGELLATKNKKEQKSVKEKPISNLIENEDEKIEFKNLTSEEVSNQILEIETPKETSKEISKDSLKELDLKSLFAVDLDVDEEVEYASELMMRKKRELVVVTSLIAVVTAVILGLILFLIASLLTG